MYKLNNKILNLNSKTIYVNSGNEAVLWFKHGNNINYGTWGENYNLYHYTPTNTYDSNLTAFVSGDTYYNSGGTSQCLATNYINKSTVVYSGGTHSFNVWAKNANVTDTTVPFIFVFKYYQSTDVGYTKNYFGLKRESLASGNARWYTEFYAAPASYDRIYSANGAAYNTNWNMITITFTPTTCLLYINGVYADTDTSLTAFNNTTTTYYNSNLILQATYTKPTYLSGAITVPFKGWTDDFKLYTKTLTQAEITTLYLEGRQ